MEPLRREIFKSNLNAITVENYQPEKVEISGDKIGTTQSMTIKFALDYSFDKDTVMQITFRDT